MVWVRGVILRNVRIATRGLGTFIVTPAAASRKLAGELLSWMTGRDETESSGIQLQRV